MVRFDLDNGWFDENGRITDRTLKRIILMFLGFLANELEDLARDMALGKIEISEFQKNSGDLIKHGYIAVGLVANASTSSPGPFPVLPAQAVSEIEAETRFSLERLERLARLVEERTMPRVRDEQSVANRSRLYAQHANVVYEAVRRLASEGIGRTEERNVLGVAEHCPECVSETGRGWVPLGRLKPPGSRLCRSNCKCHLEFR